METRRGKKETHRRKQTAVGAAGRERGWPGDEDKPTSRGAPGQRGGETWAGPPESPGVQGTTGAGRWDASRDSRPHSRSGPGAGEAQAGLRAPQHRGCSWGARRAGRPVGQKGWRGRGLRSRRVGAAGGLAGR